MVRELEPKKKKRSGVKQHIRTRIFVRDDYTCQKCGSATDLSIHHILAVQDEGKDDDDNLITLCFSCHREWGLAEMIMEISFDCWISIPPYSTMIMSFLVSTGKVANIPVKRTFVQERTRAGLVAARACGRLGGRTVKLKDGSLGLALKLYADKDNHPKDICKTLGISESTLYRYVRETKQEGEK